LPSSRSTPATSTSNKACSRWCAGTRSPWWCAPTAEHAELGGHIASYASAADLFEVGFNHFFRAGQSGDLVYFQPHSAPGVYARAYLEGRLSESQLDNYRRETAARGCRRIAILT
jgi:pyruvate dehydrogenase complex dehydrogenase (E1) component